MKLSVASDARIDAAKGVYQPDPIIEAHIGPEPVLYDPSGNTEHAYIEQARNSVTASELAADVDTAKRARAREFSPVSTALGSLAFFAFETAAGAVLGHLGGLTLGQSVIFGVMFAAVLFKLTELCSHAAANSRRYWLAMAALAAMVAGVVMVRQEGVAGDADAEAMSFAMRLAWTVIFTGITVGPAWLASQMLRAFFTGRELHADLGVKRELHRAEEKKVATAQQSARSIQIEHDAWTQTYKILKAVYDREWFRVHPIPPKSTAAAALPPMPPTDSDAAQVVLFHNKGGNA